MTAPKPKRFKLTAPSALEHAEQKALMRWVSVASRQDPRLALLFAIPNGTAASSMAEAVRAKQAGRRRGVPDLCLPVPVRQRSLEKAGEMIVFHGLFIEMKRRDGVPSDLSDEQAWWIGALTQQGYKAVVAFGWEQGRAILTDYLKPLNTPPQSDRVAFSAPVDAPVAVWDGEFEGAP